MPLFSNQNVNIKALREKAYNYRWAIHQEGIIPLTAADPDFPVAKEITEGIKQYIADGYFSYCPTEGLPQFKNAIAEWYRNNYDAEAYPEYILPVNSAAFGLFTISKSILKEGDNAIIPNPVDFLFRKSIEHAKGEVRTCELNKSNAQFDLEKLETLIDNNTKAIFICNPNNPLGKTLAKEHLIDIIEIAKRYNLCIVSDEIWADITFDTSTTSIMSTELPVYEKRIVVSGLSKNFGLAGLRMGYIICSNKDSFYSILENSAHESTAFGATGISQAAGTAAFTHAKYWLQEFKVHLSSMRKLTLKFIDEFKYLNTVNPDATYLAFPSIDYPALSSDQFVEKVLKETNVALVPGGNNWFESGSEGYLRICYSTSEEILQEAFNRMMDWKV